MVQQPPDDLLRHASLDGDGGEGVTERVKGARHVVMIPRGDMPRHAIRREYPAVVEALHRLEDGVMNFRQREPEGAS